MVFRISSESLPKMTLKLYLSVSSCCCVNDSVKTNASSESKSELIRCIVLCRQINNGCWFALVKTTYWTTRVCFSSYFSRFLRISPFLDYAHLPFFECLSWSYPEWFCSEIEFLFSNKQIQILLARSWYDFLCHRPISKEFPHIPQCYSKCLINPLIH